MTKQDTFTKAIEVSKGLIVDIYIVKKNNKYTCMYHPGYHPDWEVIARINDGKIESGQYLNDDSRYGLLLWESKNGLWKISQFIDKQSRELKNSGWIMPSGDNEKDSQTWIRYERGNFAYDYPLQIPEYVKQALYKNIV